MSSQENPSTSAAPAMTQDAIRQLVADSVATALKAQAANMANTDNTNKNTRTSETPVARKGINDHKRKLPRNLWKSSSMDYPEVLKEMLLPRSLKLWRKPST
ncbi:hypothetical protein Tco_1114269 [Tanacetum coccineum]|uniref:Uncharacterized protein n=1 Tax=Tanacetum coccineum TaxID=301880 RepID=A0ABQ5IV17_9ASTR